KLMQSKSINQKTQQLTLLLS
ncbi:transaldolase family protein, partial [Vibrio parahaemolyticus V-223/04]